MAEPPPPVATGPGVRRTWRPLVVVAAALGAILVLAVLADGRLLVADPDPSVVTAEDVRLARALFSDVAPPESLSDACLADDGTLDPACLDGGQPGTGTAASTDVIPRDCRDETSVSADCVERELGIDVPARCVDGADDLDVGCMAGTDRLLVLTDRCIDDGRLRVECLEGRVFGVPDPGPTAGEEDEDLSSAPTSTLPDLRERAQQARDRDDVRPDRDETEDEDRSGLLGLLGNLFHGVGLLVLAALVVTLVVTIALAARRWRPGSLLPVEPDPGDEAHDRAVMAASLDASALQLDLSGDPRQAIIAAYAMLLEGLAACAQGRHPAETPLEHLERVLAALDVRPGPLRDLTTLFGEARFSDHPMTRMHVDRARAALEAAAADLERVRETVG